MEFRLAHALLHIFGGKTISDWFVCPKQDGVVFYWRSSGQERIPGLVVEPPEQR